MHLKNLIGKILGLIGILGNLTLFGISILFISLNLLNTDFIDILKSNINNSLYWLAIVVCLITIIYGFVLTVFALVRLIKGRNGKFISYNIAGFLPFLIASGVIVLGFINLVNPYFHQFLTIYILYCVFTSFILIGAIFNYNI